MSYELLNPRQSTPDGLPPIREVLAALDIQPRRRLGQHFIHDLNFTRHIARAGGTLEGETVLEIGPGPGGLTRSLLADGADAVVLIERDERCLPALEAIAEQWPGRALVIHADALEFDIAACPVRPTKVIANLPYNIAAPLIVRWLTVDDWPPWWNSATLMVQLEMGQRIVAPPATRDYGRLSVLVQWRTATQLIMQVPPQVFIPPPKVESCVVQLVPRPEPATGFTPKTLEQVTKVAFAGRRKMLRRSLSGLVDNPLALLTAANVNPTLRADGASVSDYLALAREYEHCIGSG